MPPRWSVLPEEVRAAQSALPDLFPSAEEFDSDADPVRNAPFRHDSHRVLPRFPFEHAALNEIVVHERIIDLAEQLTGVSDHLYVPGDGRSAKYGQVAH